MPESGKTCKECNTRKAMRMFHQIPGPDRKLRDDVCIACRSAHDDELLALKMAQRKGDKAMPGVEKKILRKRAANRLAKRKEYKEEVSAKIAASQELARRQLARNHLLPFIKRFNKTYKDGWVHRLLCRKLEQFSQDVVDEKSPRLMVWMPPRIGKSEIVSKNFPAWDIGRNPHHEIIAASYAVSLPLVFSRKVKNILLSDSFSQVFPDCRLDPNAQATEGWYTTKEGGYVPAGVGGGITGKGAHILIIDDPVKDAEEADSETQREKVWDWYGSTAYTRLAPGGGVLVIQTRWHDADLSGKIIQRMQENERELSELIETTERDIKEAKNAEQKQMLLEELAELKGQYADLERWEILIFPQEATQDEYYDSIRNTIVYEPVERPGQVVQTCFKVRNKGDPLHPQRFTKRMVNLQKKTLQPRHWSALHQQNPVPDEGVYFTKSDFRYEPVVADHRWWDVYIAGDLALGEKQQNDYTVLMIGALDYDGVLHLLDMVRFKGKSDTIAEAVKQVLIRFEDRLVKYGLERGQIQMAIMPLLEQKLREAKISPVFDDQLMPITDKLARGRVFQGMMQQGRVLWPANQPWVEEAKAELLRFPNGLHDDIVDACAWLGRMVQKVQPPRRRREKKVKSWRDELGQYVTGSADGGNPMAA